MSQMNKRTGAMLSFLWAAMLLTSAPVAAHPEHEPRGLRVEGAWLRAMAPVQTGTAGYFALYNSGPDPQTLVSASSSIADQVEMHHHLHIDGIARMRPAGRLEVPPGSRIEFAPGGLHLMLMGIARPLTAGDIAMVNLEFADGSRLEVRFQVREPLAH